MVAESNFTVSMAKKTTVAPAQPLQEHRLPLSNLDMLLPPLDVCVFFCYDKTKTESDFEFDVLKKTLSQTLVSYYIFSAEIVTSDNVGEPELLCNNRGVDFFEAYADVELWDLNLYKPDESMGKLVPQRKHGVFAVQATKLKCGSLVVMCNFDHRIADAYSGNMFFMSWVETARSRPISVIPCLDRSLLSPRQPLCDDASLKEFYVPINPKETWNDQVEDDGGLIGRIYYIKAEKIKELQALANSNGGSVTKLVAFSAFLWKMVAKSAVRNSTKISRMSIVVDGRRRISEQNGDFSSLMGYYFGNVLSFPFHGLQVRELIENPLHWVANEVRKFLEPTLTKEHFLGLVDWIEAHKPNQVMPMMYPIGGPTFYLSSGLRYPIAQADFGWGLPAFGSYYFPSWGGEAGYVAPTPSTVVEGDWMVYMLLREGQVDVIEGEAADVFRPITSDYLNGVA